jgi:hypothetical protein
MYQHEDEKIYCQALKCSVPLSTTIDKMLIKFF